MAFRQTGREPIASKKPNFLLRVLAFLVTLVLVLGAVLLVVHRDSLNLDAIKRYFSYRTLERSDSGQAGPFRLDSDNSSCYADVNGDLLLAFNNGVRLYSGSGTAYVEETFPMEHPVVQASGKVGLVYDAGGTQLMVYRDRARAFSLRLEEGRALLSARVNSSGWLAVTAQEGGHKGTVTVYNSSYQPVMQISLSSRFIMDAVLSPDNRTVAVLTVGVGAREFESRLDFYRLDRSDEAAEPDAACVVGNLAVLDLRWEHGRLQALGDTAIAFINEDATLAGTYRYDGRFLKEYALDGSDTAALLLGKYRAGSSAALLTIGPDGLVRASLDTEEQVLSLSSAGRYLSVLTADRLDIFDQDLNLYSSLTGTQGARHVLQRPDGAAMLIGADTAHLYVPQ